MRNPSHNFIRPILRNHISNESLRPGPYLSQGDTTFDTGSISSSINHVKGEEYNASALQAEGAIVPYLRLVFGQRGNPG
jgi:hypothetical protein